MEKELKNFAECFCERYGVPQERFVDTLLERVLYPPARMLRLTRSGLLAPDRKLLSDAGFALDIRGVIAVLSQMQWYYGGTWTLRRWLRLRVSSRRVIAVAQAVFQR